MSTSLPARGQYVRGADGTFVKMVNAVRAVNRMKHTLRDMSSSVDMPIPEHDTLHGEV